MARRPDWVDAETGQLADLAREFFERECAPHERRWAEQQHVDREVWTHAGKLGLLCVSIPEEYGGGGGTFAHEAVLVSEQVHALAPSFGCSIHTGIVAPYISDFGTEEQKCRWLPRMATGELIGAIAMTEPGTGSDLQAVRTTAVRDGDEYVVNGSKIFISNGYLADLVIVVAKTDQSSGAESISLIVVETDRPGFSRGRNLEKLGQHGQDTCELFFDEVRVPVSNLIGGVEGRGFVQLMTQLAQERLLVAIIGLATMQKAMELTVEYAKHRTAFGKNLMAFQNTQFVLAECDTVISIAEAYLDRCITRHLAGELDVVSAAKAKWWLTEQQNIVVDRCTQIWGGYGYMVEYPIARLFADSRIQKVYGGTNEIMKSIIARAL